ncbi:MAG: DUF4287 domain-containing protein [Rhodoglobus sp.]
MSFRAYFDAAEQQTSITPRQLVQLATERGLAENSTKAAEILAWLRATMRWVAVMAWRASRISKFVIMLGQPAL